MTEQQPEKARVKSADDMDAETFLKHINARHVPLGKMPKVGKSNVPGDENENLLRAYHDKVHEMYDDGFEPQFKNISEVIPNHVHGPSRSGEDTK